MLAAYVATYANERSIFPATLGITLSKSVSQRRASGHCDMTPNITGTRRASVDHDCCATRGVANTVARYSARADRAIVGNIVVEDVAIDGVAAVKGQVQGRRSFHGCVICAKGPRVSEAPKLPERACFNWYIKVAQALSAELCYLRRATHPSGENEKTKRKATINMLLPFSSLIPPPSTILVRSWRFEVPASRSER